MRIFILVLVTFLFSNISHAKWGKGELKLDKETMEHVMRYMYGAGNEKYSGDADRTQDPWIMVISEDGTWSQYSYCPKEYSGNCTPPNAARNIKTCEKGSRGSPCFVFAIKKKIVWKNGGEKVRIKRKDLKSPYVVAKKIQDAGFYDGDISQLVGIDISTGQVNEDIKITGEKDNKVTSTNNEKDIVKELETLTKLYEGGSLTKEEFEKAKKKLFKN